MKTIALLLGAAVVAFVARQAIVVRYQPQQRAESRTMRDVADCEAAAPVVTVLPGPIVMPPFVPLSDYVPLDFPVDPPIGPGDRYPAPPPVVGLPFMPLSGVPGEESPATTGVVPPFGYPYPWVN